MEDESYKEFGQTNLGFACMVVGVPLLIAAWYFLITWLVGLFY